MKILNIFEILQISLFFQFLDIIEAILCEKQVVLVTLVKFS